MDERLERLLEAAHRRDYAPSHLVGFSAWITTPSGYRIYAADYGYRAFPIHERDTRQCTSRRTPTVYEPVDTGYSLGPFKVGDRVHIREHGAGTIVSITGENTIVQLDAARYLLERPNRIIRPLLTKVKA